MSSFTMKFPQVAHWGHRVSHAKNRTNHAFKYNLHTVTILVGGKKQRLRVPARVIRQLKKSGITTHYKKAE